jgi:hypothetical protein
MNSITLLGMSLIFLYGLTQILTFLHVDQSSYGPYVLFIVLIVVTSIILPHDYPDI